MDLFEALVVLFFVVLPLLQHLLGRRGTGDESDEAEHGRGGDDRTADRPEARAPEAPTWSHDWGDWPSDEEVEEAVEEDLQLEVGPDVRVRFDTPATTHDQAPALAVPEAVRVSAPVVSMERGPVIRKGERGRLHESYEAPALQGEPVRPPRIAALLRNRSDLRDAFVLNEVIGPPVSLRGFPS
jgi:hypothetical protein